MISLKTPVRYLSLGEGTSPRSAAEEKRRAEALQAAQDFESLFVTHLLKTMRSTVPKGGFLGQTFASNTYQEMFDEELGRQLARGKGLGLSDMLYREFVRQRL